MNLTVYFLANNQFSSKLSFNSSQTAKPCLAKDIVPGGYNWWLPRLSFLLTNLFDRYVAPERLNNEGFVEMITATKVRLIAIDEAHCISEWGHAFRPDYLKGAFVMKLCQNRTYAWLTPQCSCPFRQGGSSGEGPLLDSYGMRHFNFSAKCAGDRV